MERLYDQVKNHFDDALKSKYEDILSTHNIPFSSEEFPEDYFITFFVSNKDINIPKKKLSKYKQSHPSLWLSISPDRYPDFYPVKDFFILGNKEAKVINSSPIILFVQELEDKWRTEILAKVRNWINTLFSQTMLMYKEKYSITLSFFMLEMYIENPGKMFVTKLPNFRDLTFVTSSSPHTIIENEQLIQQQVEIISNSPFFKDAF